MPVQGLSVSFLIGDMLFSLWISWLNLCCLSMQIFRVIGSKVEAEYRSGSTRLDEGRQASDGILQCIAVYRPK